MAIEHAHMVLDWYEHLQKEEVPPPWMWPFHSELEIWWEEVEAKRDEKYGRSSESSGDKDVPMMSNELARGRR